MDNRTPEDVLRAYIDGSGYEIVTMGDGGRSAVPMDEAPVRAALDALVAETRRFAADVAAVSTANAKLEAELDAALRDAQQLRTAIIQARRDLDAIASRALAIQDSVLGAALSSEGQPRTEVGCAVCNPRIAARIIEAEPLPRETQQGAPASKEVSQ